MKLTLNDCLSRINQALNYPSVSYEDIYHFFDQAIAELNTSLHIAMPTVSEMVSENIFDITKQTNVVVIPTNPSFNDGDGVMLSDIETVASVDDLEPPSDGVKYRFYYKNSLEHYFIKFTADGWVRCDSLYGVYNDTVEGRRDYVALNFEDIAVWNAIDTDDDLGFDLTEYMPEEWWILFVIPYVCFKYSVRNGDTGDLFTEEFVQGFQQLQLAYCVPSKVNLYTVAGKHAYKDLVSKHLDNLTVQVFTRAIFNDMRTNSISRPTYGNTYSVGGWGI